MVRERQPGEEECRCKTFSATLNPGISIPKEATRIHGIANIDVVGKPKFEEIAEEFREWMGNRPIIGHNVEFDVKFLNAEFKRAGKRSLYRNEKFCTMRRYQKWNDGIRKGSRLDDVAKVFGLAGRKTELHGAMEDAEIALQIAALFYMADSGLKDCLPVQKPGFPSNPKTYIDESRKDTVGGGVVVGVGVIVLIALVTTCS